MERVANSPRPVTGVDIMARMSWIMSRLWWLIQLPWYILVGFEGKHYVFNENKQEGFADAYSADPGGEFCVYVPDGGIFRRGWVRPGSGGDPKRRLHIKRRWHLRDVDFFIADSDGNQRRVHFRPTKELRGWILYGEPADMRLSTYIEALETRSEGLQEDLSTRLAEIEALKACFEQFLLERSIGQAIDAGNQAMQHAVGDGVLHSADEALTQLRGIVGHIDCLVIHLQEGMASWSHDMRNRNLRVVAAHRQAQLIQHTLLTLSPIASKQIFSPLQKKVTDHLSGLIIHLQVDIDLWSMETRRRNCRIMAALKLAHFILEKVVPDKETRAALLEKEDGGEQGRRH